MFATQVLLEDLAGNIEEENDDSEIVGSIEAQDKIYEVRKGETKIGRDPGACSIVVENFTVSKVHAVIESDGIDDTFIYDVNSTNQTKLGKKVLKPHCRYKLEDGSKITVGNVTLKFMLPHKIQCQELESNRVESKPVLGNFISPNNFEDIFDVPTQVNIPQENPSVDDLHSKKVPEHFPVFKVPKSVVPEIKVEKCESINCSKTLVKAEEVSRTDCNASAIFSLNTQCQIIQPVDDADKSEDVGDGDGKSKEPDKIKSLLNDGEDDVLCMFMALHSPSGLTPNESPAKIKTEVVEPDLSQVFDAETQVQVVQPSGQDFEEKASLTKEPNSQETHITVVNNEINCSLENSCSDRSQDADEDFIATQHFADQENKLDAAQESDVECYFEKTLDVLSPDNDKEDFICTQKFNFQEEASRTVISETPQNDEFNDSAEDFMATQVFDFENEKDKAAEKAGKPGSFVVFETQEKDDVDVSADLTQRSPEEDLMCTQIFGETSPGKSRCSGKDVESDEDLIATQPVDFLVNNTAKGDPQGLKVRSVSRESSPDLLDSEFSTKIPEDFIDTAPFEDPEKEFKVSSINVKKESNLPPEQADSSGDETESDLEIIFDQSGPSDKTTKTDEICDKTDPQPEVKVDSTTEEPENDDSHASYVFHLEPGPGMEFSEPQKRRDSDSDATDCEEVFAVGVKPSLKQEPQDDCVTNEDGNECWSQLSLAMPSTQDMESTINKLLRESTADEAQQEIKRKAEGGTEPESTHSKAQIDSPLKRPGNSRAEREAVPCKKPKTESSDRRLRSSEKQFSKLWQVHDIGQIQPSRTRNSVNKPNKSASSGNFSNEIANSRRKISGSKKTGSYDITSYLRKRPSLESRNNETPSKETPEICQRVLRSSRRNSGSGSSRTTNSRPRRNSKLKTEDYFGASPVNVVFTGFDCGPLEAIISDLGGKTTDDLLSGDVVVADKVRRTVKFLCAVGLSLPITSPEWLLSCRAEKRFLNPWDFILKDEESEDKWNFELKTSLKKSAKEKLLSGLNVYATKNAKPPVKDLLAIVECCGGTPLTSPPAIWPKNTVIVSCSEDESFWPLPRLRNIKVVHYEFILSGVLTQKLDFKTYRLR